MERQARIRFPGIGRSQASRMIGRPEQRRPRPRVFPNVGRVAKVVENRGTEARDEAERSEGIRGRSRERSEKKTKDQRMVLETPGPLEKEKKKRSTLRMRTMWSAK